MWLCTNKDKQSIEALIVSVPIGGLAFARSEDQGDNGGSDQKGSNNDCRDQ